MSPAFEATSSPEASGERLLKANPCLIAIDALNELELSGILPAPVQAEAITCG
jgi:hypothetical protein